MTVKNVYYCFIIHDNRKPEAINLSKYSVVDDRGYVYEKWISKKSILKIEFTTIISTV